MAQTKFTNGMLDQKERICKGRTNSPEIGRHAIKLSLRFYHPLLVLIGKSMILFLHYLFGVKDMSGGKGENEQTAKKVRVQAVRILRRLVQTEKTKSTVLLRTVCAMQGDRTV